MHGGALATENLIEILREIDEEATLELGESRRFQMIIVGGCALILSQLTQRTITRDIDALRCDASLAEIVARHLEVNTQVGVYADRLPAGFEGRLVRLPVESQIVDFYRPSNEDLAVMKLYSWRRQDRDDLLNESMLCSLDWSCLEKLIYGPGEAKASCGTKLVYERMVKTYEQDFLPHAARNARRAGFEQWKRSGR
ncbi:MAG: hypothetical protein IJ113_00805 [Eggerthellaceae bacterium]|nr:hypothetical protein [Eggerthellaceae bacterium]